MTNDFPDLISIFVVETQEYLRSLEENLLVIESYPEERAAAVKNLFRAAHSIKGAALMFGFEHLSKAAHTLEDCFAILRDRADLSEIDEATITALLEGVDCLEKIAQKVYRKEDVKDEENQAVFQVKKQLEAKYGKQVSAGDYPIQTQIKNQTVQVIFQNDLPPILARLETELSQINSENREATFSTFNEIYYQISGLAGMLHLSEWGEIAERLRTLIDTPDLSIKTVKQLGWNIAHNLQTARNQILKGEPITLDLFELSSSVQEQEIAEKSLLNVNVEKQNTQETLTIHHAPDTNPQTSISSQQSSVTLNWQRPSIRVDLERLTELINLVGELVINRTNLEVTESKLRTEAKQIRKSIFALNQFGSELREEYDRLSIPDLKISSLGIGDIQAEQNAHFDVLELDRYTEFHSTAQSAIETTQAISRSATHIDELSQNLERNIDRLRRIADNLRSRVMQMRVVPFSRAVDHLPRALRELSRSYNKDVNLLLLGRDITIDESILEALRDPLLHLVRNAFDHGIESPEERKATGKPPSGQIEISASHQGGKTIITVTDDGRGIDPEKIRKRVVEAKFVTAEQATELSITELYEFLFVPGFSTAGEVTNLSGRGVGLDVVSNNVQQVRGIVKVDSRLGKGTSFILKLPLMLSITDALMVRVDRNTIAIPLDAVEEVIHTHGEQVQIIGKQPMLRWREEFIRLVRLQDLLHYSVAHPDGPSPDPITQDYIPVIVLGSSEGIMAIAVERILGQQEIVVKPLPQPLSKPNGIAGNTILGDGQVVTILDVDDLIAQFYHNGKIVSIDRKSELAARHFPRLAAASSYQPQILVVDDSYTIRQLLSLTLTRARYRIVQAKDGKDALSKLEEVIHCDLIISDIEMPRMDGFELLKAIKSHSTFSSIPVAMLTSRSGVKHRQNAMELGAVRYFTKPYNEVQLLEAIAQILESNRQLNPVL